MKIAICYSPWCLTFRRTLELEGYRDDPRGLSGSEMCAVRLYEEFRAMGHEVTLYADGCTPWADRGKEEHDLAISINYPDELREVRATKRVCYQLVNSFEYCRQGFDYVDLWLSPSNAHRKMILSKDHEVESDPRRGHKLMHRFTPEQWKVVPLGCDPERYDGHGPKIPGRVIYASSPDRGLHWLLQEWPHIKRAVPHATLHIFYHLKRWVDGFANTPFFPPIENQRARANYVAEALRRMSGPEWGITVRDSVSRATMEREMAYAEVLAYPCDTTRWSEGFSCTVLEACAARACPVITDCDALGDLYWSLGTAFPRVDIGAWRGGVIAALLEKESRDRINATALAFAEEHTWKKTAEKMLEACS